MESLTIVTSPPETSTHDSCHLVPCNINMTGDCKVSKYFTPYIREENNNLTCSLRGYPLNGQKIEVPHGFTGIVCTENKKLTSENKRIMKATGKFTEFMYWNWDKVPSSDDKVVKSLDWINVASALHKPVSEQELITNPKGPMKRKLSE